MENIGQFLALIGVVVGIAWLVPDLLAYKLKQKRKTKKWSTQ